MTVKENQQTNSSDQQTNSSEPPPYTVEEVPPPYTPVAENTDNIGENADYTEPPPDEGLEEYDNFIDSPDHEVAVVGRNYVTNKHVIYRIKEGVQSVDSHSTLDYDTMEIFDDKDIKQFNCVKDGGRIYISNNDFETILNVSAEVDRCSKIHVFKDYSRTEHYATIETSSRVNDDIQIYRVSVFNIATQKHEVLEMRYNKFRRYYYIFCNKDEKKKVTIGTIKVEDKTRKEYRIEIAPMVDYMLLLSFGILVSRLEHIKKIYAKIVKNLILQNILNINQ